MRCYMWMYNVSIKMRNSMIGKRLYDILEDVGIRIVVSRIANWKTARFNEKHPNEQMMASRSFFNINKDRVKRVLELLSDEESRVVLKKMISFRCSSSYSELPQNSMKTQYFANEFFSYCKKEVLIDCGAYDGDSILKFKKQMKKVSGGGIRLLLLNQIK